MTYENKNYTFLAGLWLFGLVKAMTHIFTATQEKGSESEFLTD
jgi:hypothetical protein